MKKRFSVRFIGIFIILTLLSATAAFARESAPAANTLLFTVQVNSSESEINFRAGSSKASGVISMLPNGTTLDIYDMQYNAADDLFFGYTVYHGTYGWVSLRQTVILRMVQPSLTFMVNSSAGSINFRLSPNTSSGVICEIPNGIMLDVTQLNYNTADDLFFGYTYYQGTYGWVSLRQMVLEENYAAARQTQGTEMSGYESYQKYSREPLPANQIPGNVTAGIIDWADTGWGIVAILDDNSIRYFKNEVETYYWYIPTSGDSFLFDATVFNPNARFRWYAYINGNIVRITETMTEYDMSNIAVYEVTGNTGYGYGLSDSQLVFWSPSCTIVIDSGVDEVYTKFGYTFYRKGSSVYVINANVYIMDQQIREYVEEHPITLIYLGEGELHDYYALLDPQEGESEDEAAAEFEEAYGLDTFIWGDTINYVGMDEILAFADMTRSDMMDLYITPTVNDSDMMKFDHIWFNGHEGHLRAFYKNGELDYISWTSYESSEALYQELLSYLRTFGPAGETRYPQDGQIEESAVVNGLTVYAGYEDTSNGQYTYVWADYNNRTAAQETQTAAEVPEDVSNGSSSLSGYQFYENELFSTEVPADWEVQKIKVQYFADTIIQPHEGKDRWSTIMINGGGYYDGDVEALDADYHFDHKFYEDTIAGQPAKIIERGGGALGVSVRDIYTETPDGIRFILHFTCPDGGVAYNFSEISEAMNHFIDHMQFK